MLPEELGRKFRDYIKSIRNEKPSLGNKEEILPRLIEIIERAVLKRLDSSARTGIAFSGGLDSMIIAFIASKHNKEFLLVAVGLEGSQDLDCAERIAKYYGWPLVSSAVTINEAEAIVKEVAIILNADNAINVGVGCVMYSALKTAKENGIKTVLGGLGAEEIFAGYERHRIKHIEKKNIHEECWNSLEGLYEKDLDRDSKIADELGIKLSAPFLDDEVIRYAMMIDPKLKVSNDDKKIILKDAAVAMGLRREFAFRKKKAAQYGSGFDKAIEKLARKNGFRLKKDYLRSIAK